MLETSMHYIEKLRTVLLTTLLVVLGALFKQDSPAPTWGRAAASRLGSRYLDFFLASS